MLSIIIAIVIVAATIVILASTYWFCAWDNNAWTFVSRKNKDIAWSALCIASAIWVIAVIVAGQGYFVVALAVPFIVVHRKRGLFAH